jgi:hypothetical protein
MGGHALNMVRRGAGPDWWEFRGNTLLSAVKNVL